MYDGGAFSAGGKAKAKTTAAIIASANTTPLATCGVLCVACVRESAEAKRHRARWQTSLARPSSNIPSRLRSRPRWQPGRPLSLANRRHTSRQWKAKPAHRVGPSGGFIYAEADRVSVGDKDIKHNGGDHGANNRDTHGFLGQPSLQPEPLPIQNRYTSTRQRSPCESPPKPPAAASEKGARCDRGATFDNHVSG